MPDPSEADARINIDQLLRDAGWDPSDKRQVRTEVPITLETGLAEADIRFPKKADYVLYDSNGRPLAVIEAKKSGIDPYRSKQQALQYARAIRAPFVFLSNGDVIYFWDFIEGDARPVASFFSQRDLERLVHQRKNRKDLATLPLSDNYLRSGEVRLLRLYQLACMRALDSALLLGKRRFLIELPTGCGKTDLVVLYIKRLLQAGHAERVLFLVDRESLAKQALDVIQDLLPDYSSYWLKAGTAPQHKQITVVLLQLVELDLDDRWRERVTYVEKSREEQIDDDFRAWLVSHQFTAEQADLLSMLKARGVANGKVEVADLFQPPLDHFNAPERAGQLFGPQIVEIVADLNTSVFEATA